MTSVKSNAGGGGGAPEKITWSLWLLKWSLHKSSHTSYLNRISNIYRERSDISAESNHSHLLYANHPNMSNIYPLCGWLIWAVAIWIKMHEYSSACQNWMRPAKIGLSPHYMCWIKPMNKHSYWELLMGVDRVSQRVCHIKGKWLRLQQGAQSANSRSPSVTQ